MFALVACSDDRELGAPCDACGVSLHPAGIADPASADFHGTLLRDANWDFPACQKCHGDDYQGGTSGKSCFKCHEDGPTACSTCHRADKESSSHAVHRAKFDCVECHIKPASWDAAGHIIDDSPPAEVTFGMLASAGGAPSWDGQRCSNVYCHGDTRPSAGGAMTKPVWNATPVGGCTSCHAAPPPSHARGDCATCHPASAPHVDGAVQIGRTSGCDGCHGNAGNPAPPLDLAGNMFTTAIGVGAHQAHLQGPSALRAPLPCETCHAVPATLTAAGHLDAAPADVLSALGWNRDTQTCTTWCHGNAQPKWTSSGEVVCGSCHGVPPATASHSPTMTIASCVNCHAKTVNAFGNILVSGGQHMDGDVDGN
jgi:predicted CxxxxCH...CXXCH cytochrome family protein